MKHPRTTRDRLLDAAADILECDGLPQLNTNALAERAGVTPPTVYRNFNNKEEVMECLAKRFIEAERQWLSGGDGSLDIEGDLEAIVGALIERYWASAREHRGIVALRSAMRVWPSLRPIEEASLRSSTRLLADLLAPHLPDVPPKRLSRIARYTVETVCASVDRCYPLAPDEQSWRIKHLKSCIAMYLSSQASRA